MRFANERNTHTGSTNTGTNSACEKSRRSGAVRRRLMDMGMVRGIEVELLKAAPLGDPLEYLLRGYHLSLRKIEAQAIKIEVTREDMP